MMNIINKFKINNYTYLFIIICLFSGFIKNICIIFSICLIHELGHIFFIKIFKYKIIRVELFPFGGYTTIDKQINSSINKDLIISIGGVLFQILLLCIIYVFKSNINSITFNMLIKYNIVLIIFNLLPIIPLDGNIIVHLLLEKVFSYNLAYKINYILSLIFLIIFIIINYLYNIDNYFIIMFLLYKLVVDIKNYKYYRNKFLVERYLYDYPYKRINNNTENINELKKEVYHYFKKNNKYISEKNAIYEYLRNK